MCYKSLELRVQLIHQHLGLLYQVVLRNPEVFSVSLGLVAT